MAIAVIFLGIGVVTLTIAVFGLQVQINKLKLDLQKLKTNRIEAIHGKLGSKQNSKPRDGLFPFDEINTVKNPIDTIKTSVNEVINNVKNERR